MVDGGGSEHISKEYKSINEIVSDLRGTTCDRERRRVGSLHVELLGCGVVGYPTVSFKRAH